jgi:nucleotide-binding universal stress UspA family protein
VLVHCFDIRHVVAFPQQIKEYIEGTLGKQKDILEKQGFATTVRAVPGLPEVEVPRVAQKEGCSLIVVGSHGHNLGGVASAVIHHASMPVLILRLTTADNGQPVCVTGKCDFLDHVLFPTDFSDNAEHAFAYVQAVVKSGARRVTLLHVQDKTRLGKHLEHRLEEFNEIDRGRLERLKGQLEKDGAADVRVELPYGVPTAEIVDRAREGRASLVVMGSHGRGFISEVFLGSVSHNVARHAEAPVLLIPMPEKGNEGS